MSDGEAWPGQADFEDGIFEMQRRQTGRAERPVLLLRVLQNKQLDAVFDRLDVLADA